MTSTFLSVFAAVCLVETGGDASAVNREYGAYGIAQIRQEALDDINAKHKTSYKLQDFVDNIPLSRWAFYTYGHLYGAVTSEDYARIWHGGPGGKDDPKTDKYWERVKNLMGAI